MLVNHKLHEECLLDNIGDYDVILLASKTYEDEHACYVSYLHVLRVLSAPPHGDEWEHTAISNYLQT